MTTARGKVYLVGAGPGDPGLLTLRGRECLERADVVIYDQLVNEELLGYAQSAEHIFVGKQAHRHTLPQEDINRLLIEQAARAVCVVRLKGGDPCVLGRGGEEALALAAAGVPFEIVPGVTAGIAAPIYAGIPVTHRGMSSSCSLIAGHDVTELTDLRAIMTDGTQVFYMAVGNLEAIVAAVQRAGRGPQTPAALIQRGTVSRQITVSGTLATIGLQCRQLQVAPPAVLIVGDVVSLRSQISWFENRPLYGVKIALTRTRAQASALARRLRELGADVFEFPTMRVEPPEEAVPFGYIGEYDWILLTSANAVEMLFERLVHEKWDARDLAGVKLCASGSTTLDVVASRFLRVDAVPDLFEPEHVIAAIETVGGPVTGQRILLPRADLARSSLTQALRDRGAEVVELVAYRAVVLEPSEALIGQLLRFAPDVLVFTSSRAVHGFCEMLDPGRLAALTRATIASIGPVTSAALRNAGLQVDVEPHVHDVASLVGAIVAAARRKRPKP
jgi:uroporphyrinogen III methyltransferase / synthase